MLDASFVLIGEIFRYRVDEGANPKPSSILLEQFSAACKLLEMIRIANNSEISPRSFDICLPIGIKYSSSGTTLVLYNNLCSKITGLSSRIALLKALWHQRDLKVKLL